MSFLVILFNGVILCTLFTSMSLHTRLFVGNVPLEVNDTDIHEAFSSYGKIINLELKTKSGTENDYDKKRFAFITLSASNYDIESCIKNFTNADFKGNRLYVTRARESFLERLERERNQVSKREQEKNTQDKLIENVAKEIPVIKLSAKLNPQKRKIDFLNETSDFGEKTKLQKQTKNSEDVHQSNSAEYNKSFKAQDKKQNSEKKRLEALKKKSQEFKEKKMIIKTGFIGIDKVSNKKVIFSDNDEYSLLHEVISENNFDVAGKDMNYKTNTLFDDDDSDLDVNFEIKTQFEGKKGQKVLDLQSRYKSDKRFTLDERFIDEDQSGDENEPKKYDDVIDIGQSNEKLKQLNILQDVLGVSIKINNYNSDQKTKSKLGMLRYDPMHPDHAKFLAPTTNQQELPKKVKKKKTTNIQDDPVVEQQVVQKVEVSKEQFYKVSDTLKEAMVQPSSFSLRNLFAREDNDEGQEEQNSDYVPLPKEKEKKSKNPLDIQEKNPFVYDSSDSESEDNKKKIMTPQENTEVKAVWRENLFFSKDDYRLKEGLLFFTKNDNESERQKERRGLKSVMKKRIYNKDRKMQMFQKKIGGRKKSMKKSTRGKRR